MHIFIDCVELEKGSGVRLHSGAFNFKEPILPTVLAEKFLLSIPHAGAYELQISVHPRGWNSPKLIHTFSFTATKIEEKKDA